MSSSNAVRICARSTEFQWPQPGRSLCQTTSAVSEIRKETNEDDSDTPREPGEISHGDEEYLAFIVSHAFVSESRRDDMFKNEKRGKWSRRKGSDRRAVLKARNYVKEFAVNVGSAGKVINLLEPTENTIELLNRRGIPYTLPRGHGNIVHKFWMFVVSKALEKQGWKTELEQRLKNKQVDVGATRAAAGGKTERIAYEILNANVHKEVVNYEKDLADGWDAVVFCVPTDGDLVALTDLLPREGRHEVTLLKEYVPGQAKLF
jgi:hypothetical protein